MFQGCERKYVTFWVCNVPCRPQVTEQRKCITETSRPALQPATAEQQVHLEAGHDPSRRICISLFVINTFSFTSTGLCFYVTCGEADGVVCV